MYTTKWWQQTFEYSDVSYRWMLNLVSHFYSIHMLQNKLQVEILNTSHTKEHMDLTHQENKPSLNLHMYYSLRANSHAAQGHVYIDICSKIKQI